MQNEDDNKNNSFTRGWLLLLDEHFKWTVAIILIAGAALVVWRLQVMSQSLVREDATRDAAAYSGSIATVRKIYASEVAARVKSANGKVTHDYKNHAGAIPLPATFTKLISKELGNRGETFSARLYSNTPYPWVKNGGPQDDFERDAIEQVRKDPSKPYQQFETIDGQHYIRYATADVMKQNCVSCHNSHPESPKRDWKVGDVRGVLSVRMPLTASIQRTNEKSQEVLWIIAGIAGVVVLLFALTMRRLKRQAVYLKKTKDHMKQAKESAEIATRIKSEFLANMSHEIRTPMTAILGFSELALENTSSPQQAEELQTVHKNSKHLLDIINDILDISKIESGKMHVERIRCSLCQMLSGVISLMRVQANAKKLKLSLSYKGDIPEFILSDPTRLQQIFVNLISNAIKFTKQGEIQVVIQLVEKESGNPKIQMDVIDQGIGMTAAQIEKAFQPFVQADTSTTREFGGTGLGVSISKQLAQLLGGDISFKSTPNQGTTCTLLVETGSLEGVALFSEPVEGKSASLKKQQKTVQKIEQENCRILLAEDGLDNQRLISFILKKSGAEVTIAENGQMAFDLAWKAQAIGQPFDVVLMDMQMPILSGYQATRKLRTVGYDRPVIALTAHAMDGDRQKCLDAGCDDYTTKPINRKQLISLINQYCLQTSR